MIIELQYVIAAYFALAGVALMLATIAAVFLFLRRK